MQLSILPNYYSKRNAYRTNKNNVNMLNYKLSKDNVSFASNRCLSYSKNK